MLAVAPDLPPRVAEVIDRALAFLPADRWPDARAMQAVLEDAHFFSYGAPLRRGLESSRRPFSSVAAPAPAVDPRALTELAFPLVPSSHKATTTNGLAQEEIRIPVRRIPWGTLLLGACAVTGVVVGALGLEGKGPLGGRPTPTPLSAERSSAWPEAQRVAPAVSIAPPPPAVPMPPGPSAAPAVDAATSIEAHPFVDGEAPIASPPASAASAARSAVAPTPRADARPSSTPPSPATPPEIEPTIPGCNPTFFIDAEGHKIYKPECFPGKAPPL